MTTTWALAQSAPLSRRKTLASPPWRKLPAELRDQADEILLGAAAAAAGAGLEDLATLAAYAIEQWRQQRPDADDPDPDPDDRYVQAGTTFGGAGVIRGNLTLERATAVRAVREVLGKRQGPEDDRTEGAAVPRRPAAGMPRAAPR